MPPVGIFFFFFIVLDKARCNLPEKPLSPKKTGAVADDDMELKNIVGDGGGKMACEGTNTPSCLLNPLNSKPQSHQASGRRPTP